MYHYKILLVLSIGLILTVTSNCQDNVDFWKKIYTHYHTQQGVIHDAENVKIIYEVIDLKPRGKRGARRASAGVARAGERISNAP